MNCCVFGKAPDVLIERAEFFFDLEEGLCILDRGRNFEAIANDALILLELKKFRIVIRGNFLRVEVVKGDTKSIALIQDTFP